MFGLTSKKYDNVLYSPVNGTMIAIESVPDTVFNSQMMGQGVGFQFEEDMVYAPCNGVISFVAPTKHAIGIKMKNSQEVLIHIGLDTVNLKGEGFEILIKNGQYVKIGTPILKINQDLMNAKDINMITPLVITNSQEFHVEIIVPYGRVRATDKILEVNLR